MEHICGCDTDSEWEQMIEQFNNEIGKDLLNGLPILIGFYDSTYRNDLCPSMANDYLGIQIFIDYPFEESEWDNIEDYHKYTMHFLDKEHNPKDNVVHFDKIDEVKLAIEVIRGSKQ